MLLVVATAGMEMAPKIGAWLAGETPWPQGVLLDALVAGSAALLAAAVLMTRRSVERTANSKNSRTLCSCPLGQSVRRCS